MSETKPSGTVLFETKRGKVVGRNVAIALGIICIVLVAGLGVVIYMGYSPTASSSTISLQSQINDLNSTYKSYVSTHSHTNDDFNSLSSQNANLTNQYNNYVGNYSHTNEEYQQLQNQYNTYVGDHGYTNDEYQNLQNQITNLQSQIANLQAPNLIKVNLKADDNRPFLGTPYLHVYGEICNVGTNTANNCRLHVVAYQSGGVVAINTDIVLGTIAGKAWVSVDGSPTYSGGSLTSWTVTPTWS